MVLILVMNWCFHENQIYPLTSYLQPVVLASVPGVTRASPSFLDTRPVLQAADKYLLIRAIPTGCQGAQRSGATPGTEVGIVRIWLKGKTAIPTYIIYKTYTSGGEQLRALQRYLGGLRTLILENKCSQYTLLRVCHPPQSN